MYSLSDIPMRTSGDKPIGPIPAGAYRFQILDVTVFADRDVSLKFDMRVVGGPMKNRRMFPRLTMNDLDDAGKPTKRMNYGYPIIGEIAFACGMEEGAAFKDEQQLADYLKDKEVILQVSVGKPYTKQSTGETKIENEIKHAFRLDKSNRGNAKCPPVSDDPDQVDIAF